MVRVKLQVRVSRPACPRGPRSVVQVEGAHAEELGRLAHCACTPAAPLLWPLTPALLSTSPTQPAELPATSSSLTRHVSLPFPHLDVHICVSAGAILGARSGGDDPLVLFWAAAGRGQRVGAVSSGRSPIWAPPMVVFLQPFQHTTRCCLAWRGPSLQTLLKQGMESRASNVQARAHPGSPPTVLRVARAASDAASSIVTLHSPSLPSSHLSYTKRDCRACSLGRAGWVWVVQLGC